MNRLEQACQIIIEELDEMEAYELLDILTTAKLNGYENADPESFPDRFYDAYDLALSKKDGMV